MKIAVFNGSARKENTYAMVEAFREGAQEAGHEVEVYQVGKMKIAGCLGCEYCHTKGGGSCIQKDDLEKIMPAYKEADMIVFASPIYYFNMTAQIEAAIQRVYCIGKPQKATKAALLVSSGSPNTGSAAVEMYKNMLAYLGMEDAGVCVLAGEENKSEEKLAAIRDWAKSL